MGRHRLLLTLAALGCFAISALHILLSFGGIAINRFFGAPPAIEKLIVEGSWLMPAMCFGITLLFLVFGLYALSGAGRFRRLPLLKSVILFLGVILTLRGANIIAVIQETLKYPGPYPWQFLLMSLGSLLMGLAALWGTVELFRFQRRERAGLKAGTETIEGVTSRSGT